MKRRYNGRPDRDDGDEIREAYAGASSSTVNRQTRVQQEKVDERTQAPQGQGTPNSLVGLRTDLSKSN
jgi:hypothetical protein